MRDVDFDEPVELLTKVRGKHRLVITAGQAVDSLLNDWPVKPGPSHHIARQALFDLFEGRLSPREAREAFEAAADEAEIRVGGWHRGNPVAVFMSKHKPIVGVPVPRPRRK